MTTVQLDPISVEIEINYSFLTSTQMYVAKVTAFLPVEDNGFIHTILRDNHTNFLSSPLQCCWGCKEGENRVNSKSLEDSELDLLRGTVSEYLKDQMETLQSLVTRNRDKISILPKTNYVECWTI